MQPTLTAGSPPSHPPRRTLKTNTQTLPIYRLQFPASVLSVPNFQFRMPTQFTIHCRPADRAAQKPHACWKCGQSGTRSWDGGGSGSRSWLTDGAANSMLGLKYRKSCCSLLLLLLLLSFLTENCWQTVAKILSSMHTKNAARSFAGMRSRWSCAPGRQLGHPLGQSSAAQASTQLCNHKVAPARLCLLATDWNS